MSEHDFKHAATDAKHTQVEATREAAEIISALIKAAMRERDGKEPKKAPKVEIFSGPNKIYPPRDGVEIKPEQVDNLLDTLANEKAGSVRIYLEQDGKREKIFHQTQGVVKADPLGLKEAMAEKLGPKLADRQKAEVEQQAKLEKKEEPKQTTNQTTDQKQSSEVVDSTQALQQSSSGELDFNHGEIPQDLGIPELQGVDPAKVIEFDKDLAISWNYALSDVNRVNESRKSIGADGASYKEAEAVQSIMQARNSIQEQIRVNGYTNAQLKGAPQASEAEEKTQAQTTEVTQPKAPETQVNPDIKPSHEQSSDIPSLDHPEQAQSQEESPSSQEEVTVERTQAQEESKTQTQQPSEALEQGDRSQEASVGESVAPVADNLKYPDETQAQASNLDPAYQAAKAEFDRRLSQFQDNLDKLQQQVHKVSEQIAPLVNDPNLQQWAKEGSQRHHQAMRPLRDQISVVRQTVYNRLKNMGQKMDDLGRKATEKLSDLQAKAIDKSVTWLVNSRYGQDTGRGGRVFEGDNQTFKKIGNSVIISRNSDKAEVYNNGRYTKAANTQDKKAIAALPSKVVDLRQKIEQKQSQSQSQSQQRSAGRGR